MLTVGPLSFSNFINSAARQLSFVVEVIEAGDGVHFVVDMTTHNTLLEQQLDSLASTVKSRWPGKGFSWSPLNDHPYTIDRYEEPFSRQVYTVPDSPAVRNYRQKRDIV